MDQPTGARVVLLTLTLISLFFPNSLAAQNWSLDTYVGRTSYESTPLSSTASRTGVVGVRYNEDRFLFQAAGGAPFSNRDLTWGIVGLQDRLAVHRSGLVTGLDFSIFGHAQWDPVAHTAGKGIVGEFLPLISHNVGSSVLEFRSGARWYGERLGSTNWTRTLWSTDVRGSIETGPGLRLEGTLRHDRAKAGENYTRPGGALTVGAGRFAVRGSIGDWINGPADSGVELGLSTALALTPRLWFVSSVQHQSFDPTFLAAPRTSWGIGLTVRVGASSNDSRPEIRETDRIVIRVPLRDAGSTPSIAGDFTNWMPVRMSRYDHEWRYVVNLVPGVYRYAFRDKDGKWFVPASFPNRVDDGMGGWSAVLIVS